MFNCLRALKRGSLAINLVACSHVALLVTAFSLSNSLNASIACFLFENISFCEELFVWVVPGLLPSLESGSLSTVTLAALLLLLLIDAVGRGIIVDSVGNSISAKVALIAWSISDWSILLLLIDSLGVCLFLDLDSCSSNSIGFSQRDSLVTEL